MTSKADTVDLHGVKIVGFYNIWNIVRYITIGILIFYANKQNVAEMEDYKKYCCDCYYVSLDPHL